MVFLLLLLLAVTRLGQVHSDTWEWRLTPSAAPPKIQLDGRSYLRGAAGDRVPAGATVAGHTTGGAPIYVGERIAGAAPTVVEVVDGATTWGYGLSGGP